MLSSPFKQSSKYNSSKSYGSSSDRYERIRDSPNGNYRSDSPDSQSPRERDRSYQSKGSYLQKIREKERENRDYKMSRDKYSGKKVDINKLSDFRYAFISVIYFLQQNFSYSLHR